MLPYTPKKQPPSAAVLVASKGWGLTDPETHPWYFTEMRDAKAPAIGITLCPICAIPQQLELDASGKPTRLPNKNVFMPRREVEVDGQQQSFYVGQCQDCGVIFWAST
jgi:hypothetical protein